MGIYVPTPQALGASVARAADGEAPSGAILGGEVEPAYDAIARLQQLVNPGEGDGSPAAFLRAAVGGAPIIRCGRGTGANVGLIVSDTDPVDATNVCLLEYALDLPDGCTLSALDMWVRGGGGSGLPDGPITMELYYWTLSTGARAVLGEWFDAPVNEAAFEAHHAFFATDIDHVIVRQDRKYFVLVTGEWGASRLAGTRYFGLNATHSINTIDRGR
jgi:hypothetical protein